MANPNLGDALTYDGSAWVNQRRVQGTFAIGASAPWAQVEVQAVAPA